MGQVRSVLLVDDDADIRTIGAISLEQVGGLTVTCADCGAAGIAAASAEPPDVILLDMMMPDMDGLTTLARLRTDPSTSAIPVIFMTAKVQLDDVGRYLDAGAVGVIAKPFDPMSLASEVRSIVASQGQDLR